VNRFPLAAASALLASALVIAAAVTSLFGSEPVQRLVGSAWFLTGTGIVALAGLLAAVIVVSRRSWPSVVQHVGLVIALSGVAVNQKSARSDYLFLEQGGGASNFALGRNLRRVDELPVPLALDSLTSFSAKAFRPAPVAWVTVADGRSRPVAYNRPLRVAGRQILLSQTVAPGFLAEYEIELDGTEYVLLHNQATEPSSGLRLWSFAYDADAGRVGLMLGNEQRWLGIGESAAVQGRALKLLSATFAANAGAIFVVNDARYRFIIFLGFGLVLLGLLPPLFRKEAQ
jgi:type IV secretory pathway TrbD component